MATNIEKFRGLLQELFQLDQADLDFGIYRIMNQKRDEVVRFLDRDLLPQVQAAFARYQSADKTALRSELDKLERGIRDAGMNPDESPKVKGLRAQIAGSTVDVTALENEVFSHLFNFFRRYYSEGDFISQRRYKAGVYAIPYEGEEVKLHWANADQYYIKSSETFRDYTFTIASGKRVRVHLVAATTEQDNNKPAAGKERRFVLSGTNPVTVESGELYVRFEYRETEGKAKQDDLNAEAIDAILKTKGLEEWTRELGKGAPTPTNKTRTVLEKHLTQYTARNTFDYFIHKDLGGFLRRELDFFIKNEVMHLDDIEQESAPKVEQYLSQIRVIRAIAHKIIAFLEQLENFQKRLWLKKKFVIETSYCITPDRVPENLYPEIVKNDAQREEWVKLFAIDEIKADVISPGYSVPLKVEFLKVNPALVLDTKFFSQEFKDLLLRSLSQLDVNTDGVLIHGENSQALSLMWLRYREKIKCVYIDPPYNTGGDGFSYKDTYQHSSWLAMMHSRLLASRLLLSEDGVVFSSIDDIEQPLLRILFDESFGVGNRIANMVWKGATDNNPTRIATEHEYLVWYAKSLHHTDSEWKSSANHAKSLMLEEYARLVALGLKPDEIQAAFRRFVKDNKESLHPLTHYDRIDSDGVYTGSRKVHNPGKEGYRYDVIHNVTRRPCVQPARGYRYPQETMLKLLSQGKILFGDDENQIIQIKEYLHDYAGGLKGLVELDSRAAANSIEGLFASRDIFKNPKPVDLLADLHSFVLPPAATSLDFFAGSGTTGQAIINLNREDSGRRKFILVEVGAHFNTVLLPRIKKVTYSADWKDGKPTSQLDQQQLDASPKILKYIRLESYEDALANLEMKRSERQQSLIDDDADVREQYLLSYMLDVESRGSLLNVDGFRNPDEYKLRVERDGETQLVTVDLVETFNWLLGLTVNHIDRIAGVRVVEGTNPDGERVLVLWRNIDEMDGDKLDKWFKKQRYSTQDLEFDLVYVNGDNNLENLRRGDQTWKVRLIEDEFRRLMFDVRDV